MASKIDGYDVKVGDILYDWFLGRGQVISIDSDGSIVMKFGERVSRYNSDGSKGQSAKNQLSWQDMNRFPRPRPGDAGENEMKLIITIMDYIRKSLGE